MPSTAGRVALIQLPLHRAIFELAWPAMASSMLVNVFNLVDAFWVGRLGTAALGGMTASAFLVWCLHAVGQLVGTGVNAVVARRVGEKREVRAGVAAGHGLLLAFGLALVTMAATLPARTALLAALHLSPGVERAAGDYLLPILCGFPTITCWYAVEAVFRGSGDTRTPMVVLGGTLLLNAALDPLLIFGLGPVPAMGIAGAAWATVLSHALGTLSGIALLRRRAVRPQLPGVELGVFLILLRVGAPVAVSSFLFSVIYIVLAGIIAAHGGHALAAVGVGHRVEGLAYFTCLGFAAAAATLVGQHLGAGQPGRAGRAAWLSTGYASVALLVLSVLFYLLAPQIFSVFSNDSKVIAEGTHYLRIIALFEVGMAGELVLEGAFAGAGNALPPMLVCVPLTALRIPAAHLLSRRVGLGSGGIWWAISGTTGIKGLVMAAWFRLNRWKRMKV
jgi:putative MATE family efflux protein